MPESGPVSRMMLTIAIPTFNRPKQLRTTLEIILPQLVPGVELIILDNASEVPAQTILDGLAVPACRGSSIRVVRNERNIGANANIIRCLESAESKWVWILGDDDRPRSDAVERITRDIVSAKHCCCMMYSYDGYEHAADRTCESYGELDVERYFGGLTFISTCVYNKAACTPHLGFGYDMTYACASHFAIMSAAVVKGGFPVCYRGDSIVDSGGSESGTSYSYLRVKLRFLALLELPFLHLEEKRALYRGIRRCTYPNVRAVLTDVLAIAWGEETGVYRNGDARLYFKEWFVRYRRWREPDLLLRAAAGLLGFLLNFRWLLVSAIRARQRLRGSPVWSITELNNRI